MRNYLSKKILSTPSRRVEHAAWDLLIAIRELFPERFAELQAIADDILAAEGLTDEDDPRIHGEFFGADYEELHASVKEWAERHRI